MLLHRIVRVLQVLVLAVAIDALGYYAYIKIDAIRFEIRSARQFAEELRHRATPAVPGPSAPSPAPTPAPALHDGQTLGKIQIPRLGLSAMVVEGDSAADLRRAAGHIPGTSLPWQAGNVGVAAHRDTYFRSLRLIRPNDVITLTTLEGVYRYRVVSTQVVTPDDVAVLASTGRDALTLVTCFPFYYVGAAPRRFIVHASRG